MASQKDRLLESAQKFILKGQLDKAIRDYQQIVALDPKYRQKLAELLVRAGRREDAIAEYDIIAKGYADTYFYLKAIAVYKQIQKLDPDAIRINSNLATLYEKQGLTANALAEYRTVFEYFEKQRQPAEGIKILEKMQEIEPENPAVLLKLAEVRFQTDQKEMAYHEFKQLALLLRNKGDEAAFSGVCGRIGQLFPDKKDLVLELLSAEIERGKAVEAIQTLQGMLKRDPADLKVLNLLVAAFRATGDLKNRKIAYQHIMRHYPDDFLPKEGLIECAVEEGEVEKALTLLRFNAADFIARGRLESLEGFYHQLRSIAPDDPRIIAGLIKLYESDGQAEKAEAMKLLLGQLQEILSADAGTGAAPDAVPDAGEEPAGRDDLHPAPVPSPESVPSVPWEEEIILDLPADDPARALMQHMVPEAAAAAEELLPEVELEVEDEIIEPGADDEVAPPSSQDGYMEVDFDFDESELDFLESPDLTSAGSTGEDGEIIYTFDELLSKFKEGVDRQLEKSDTENHYNLGIAYKEMGLLDEAIAEFGIASADPQRRVACATLEGICCRDKGDYGRAEEVFLAAGALDLLSAEEVLCLSYELALVYECTSRPDEAMGLYRAIWQQRPDYRDVEEKVKGKGESDIEELDDLDLIELDNEDV